MARRRFIVVRGDPLMSDATAVVRSPAKSATLVSELAFLVQVSRPGLWSTTALFYLMPLGHANIFHSRIFWVGLFYVLFPLGLVLYGVNDIVDANGDQFNPRKGTFLFGSLGGSEQLSALRWQIVVVQIPFLALFYVLVGPRILWWLGVLGLAVGLYNAPRIGWKGRPPFDVLIQTSYLLIFVLSSWLNHAAQLPWATFLFGALFAMHSHVFGEVMDIAPDRLSGRRTTATSIGAVGAKFLIAALLSVESALVSWEFRSVLIAAFLAAGAVWFVLDARIFWKNHAYTPAQMRLFMWAWNATSLAGMYWNWAHAGLTQARPFAL
jgi:4-hydroxybenzoate polyprenyltransferase